MLRSFLTILLSVVAITAGTSGRAVAMEADVIVYGGTSAGVTAAIQAARMGKTVVLISPERRLGGMTTNGLGATDSGNKAVVGGMAREFYQRVKKHYDDPRAWTLVRREEYPYYRAKDDAMWMFEPHVAEQTFEVMLREAKVNVIREERLDRSAGGVTLQDNRLTAIRTEPTGAEYRGQMFIDATYEGDLLAASGVTYTIGREANGKYDETCNGVQKSKNVKNHRFLVPVDPYIVRGDPASGLLSGIHGDAPGEEGQADHRVQAYCFRMCMSNVPKNRISFPKPENYDEARYELLLRNFEAGDRRVPIHPLMMPNGKTDTNNNGAFSTDNIGMNYDYPEASYERRTEILHEHRDYQQGLMWTLANHPRVPGEVREEMRQWGLAKDEFTDNGNWPTEFYVREARRMVSDYVMTEHDTRLARLPEDSIGMGSYNLDSHNCQRYIGADGHAANEGDVQVAPGGPYTISYRAIVPSRGEAGNLLAPVCISASHIAYGSIRMEPVFMILGQSAATAACHAVDDDAAVQDVDYKQLAARLLADGQVLQYMAVSKADR